MKNLNVPGQFASSTLQTGLVALGCNPVLVNNSLHVEGTVEQEAAAVAFVAAFDLAAGAFADKTKNFEKAVDKHILLAIQALGYKNEDSIAKYLVVGNPFYVEASSLSLWVGELWTYCYAQLALVKAGARTEPTVEALIAELPTRI